MPRKYRTLTISDYDITVDGEVINKLTGKRLKGQFNGKGYLRVGIGKKSFLSIDLLQKNIFLTQKENRK